ncbi:MAG: heme ABC exporter ATP-binding protein CcmA [Deltaproteobacteria bacterium]|nr:heme ABC exporter ATP-binding protein CcmA [Deltaproteobacteria bacterium]
MGAGFRSVRLEKITKVYGAFRALAGVSLSFVPKEVVAVMGPNGAGKSTMLGILSLTVRPTQGAVTFDGEKGRSRDTSLRGRIGLLSHQPLLYPELTGRENLLLFARLHGVEGAAARVSALESELELDAFAKRPCRVLSRGQLQRVALARAMLATPDLLLLDEPAAGLDSAAVGRISGALARHKERGGIAVMVTHEPEVASEVATRAVMIRGGRVVADVPAPQGPQAWRALYRDVVEQGGAK